MIKKILIFSICLIVAGCASPRAIPKKYDVPGLEKFAPINLDIKAGEYVTTNEAQIIDYISKAIHESELFSRIETSFLRWPYTMVIRYGWEQPLDLLDFASIMVSASTLLLIPGYAEETHTMHVEILRGNTIVKESKYQQKARTAMSLYHNPIEDRKNIVNMLLEQIFADIRLNKLLPTLTDIEPKERKVKTPI